MHTQCPLWRDIATAPECDLSRVSDPRRAVRILHESGCRDLNPGPQRPESEKAHNGGRPRTIVAGQSVSSMSANDRE
jgi:hypothetical protein